MDSMFEGAIKKGRVQGQFGRLLTRGGDNFLGYLTGDPLTGTAGAIGKGAWWTDLELQAQGVWRTTDAAGLPFDAAYDRSTEDFVWWDFRSFEREDIPYHVLYDEASACRWNDGSCLYWAYQYDAWGTRPMPAEIRDNKYYIAGGATAEAADETEEEYTGKWEEGDDWDFEKEEEWTDEEWSTYAVDLTDIDLDEYGFDFEEDFGFYDLAGEADEDSYEEIDYGEIFGGDVWTRPSDEWAADFDTEDAKFVDPENYDWESDESWSHVTYTDEYGQEYQNFTYTSDGTEEDMGYNMTHYTDQWGTNDYSVYYADGSFFQAKINEDEGWNDYYSEDIDGVWFSE